MSTKCPACSSAIAEEARFCPRCGRPCDQQLANLTAKQIAELAELDRRRREAEAKTAALRAKRQSAKAMKNVRAEANIAEEKAADAELAEYFASHPGLLIAIILGFVLLVLLVVYTSS